MDIQESQANLIGGEEGGAYCTMLPWKQRSIKIVHEKFHVVFKLFVLLVNECKEYAWCTFH